MCLPKDWLVGPRKIDILWPAYIAAGRYGLHFTVCIHFQVKEGDVIEVDTILDARPQDLGNQGEGEGRKLTKRGRVVVKEIGPKTRKGGYLLTLIRYKQFALFRRNFNSWTVVHFCKKFLEQ